MTWADAPGARLWFDAAGDGPEIVLLHNGLFDARMWDAQMHPFAQQFRVVRYDMRFYGRSERPEGQPYSELDDLAAVMDAAGVERAALVGNSLGGRIALDFALERAERVSALVLVAPGLGGFPLDGVYSAEQEAEFEAALARGDDRRAVEIDLEVWAPLGADEAMMRLALDNVHVNRLDQASAAAMLEPRAVERLAEVRVPTLVVTGDHDVSAMQQIGDRLESGIAGARRVRMDADHMPSMRQPEEFNRVVRAFLAGSAP